MGPEPSPPLRVPRMGFSVWPRFLSVSAQEWVCSACTSGACPAWALGHPRQPPPRQHLLWLPPASSSLPLEAQPPPS